MSGARDLRSFLLRPDIAALVNDPAALTEAYAAEFCLADGEECACDLCQPVAFRGAQ